MRVVLAGDYPAEPPHIVGGIQAVTYYTTEALTDDDNLYLQVVTCEQWAGPQRTVSRGKIVVHYLEASSRLPYSVASWTSDRSRIRDRLVELAPDLVHVHGQNRYPLAAMDSGLPWVMTVHGLNYQEQVVKDWRKTPRHLTRTLLWALAERYALKKANDIVVISPYVEDQIRRHTKARLHTIHNPVHGEFFRIRGSGLPGRILYVGIIQPRKDLLTLLRAMKRILSRFPDVQLNIVGKAFPTGQDYADTLRQFVQDNGLGRCVSFLGFVSHERLLREYEECQVFAFPSVEESSPVAVAQAMAAGRAVLTTDIGGTSHLISDGETGFRVTAGDDEMMAERLCQLVEDNELRGRLASGARRWASQNLTASEAARKTVDMYSTILASGAAHR